jgi:hypothetical protein
MFFNLKPKVYFKKKLFKGGDPRRVFNLDQHPTRVKTIRPISVKVDIVGSCDSGTSYGSAYIQRRGKRLNYVLVTGQLTFIVALSKVTAFFF